MMSAHLGRAERLGHAGAVGGGGQIEPATALRRMAGAGRVAVVEVSGIDDERSANRRGRRRSAGMSGVVRHLRNLDAVDEDDRIEREAVLPGGMAERKARRSGRRCNTRAWRSARLGRRRFQGPGPRMAGTDGVAAA